MQADGSLDTQNAHQRIGHTLLGDDAVLVTGHHVAEVFLHIIEEQIHIAACGNGSGNLLGSGHCTEHTDHVGSIGDDQAVEAQLGLQQALDQLRAQGCGQDLVVIQIPASQLTLPCGLGNMACHDGLDAVVDELLVDLAEGIHPLLAGQVIDAHHQVLVVFFGAVAGPMLDGGSHLALLIALHEGFGIFHSAVCVIAVGAELNDGISPVLQQVNDGRKVPVGTDGHGFRAADLAAGVSHLRITGGCGCSTAGDVGTAADAALTVGSHQQRDPAAILEGVDHVPQLGCGSVVVAQGTGMVGICNLLDALRAEVIDHVDEQLTDLLLVGHAGNGVHDPLDVLIGQIIGFCLQIDHKRISFSV